MADQPQVPRSSSGPGSDGDLTSNDVRERPGGSSGDVGDGVRADARVPDPKTRKGQDGQNTAPPQEQPTEKKPSKIKQLWEKSGLDVQVA